MKPWAYGALTGTGLAVLFAANIGGYALWPADEPRYAEVAREMLLTGDWLAPHVNGQPYTEKPPLLFWAIALCSIPFGGVNEISARLPSVLSALIVCWFTYLLARDLYDRKTAILAVVVLATFGRFWWQARTAQIDMLLTANLTAATYCFWEWHTQRDRRYLVFLYTLVALAVYAKGPPGIVFPLLLLFAFYWKQRDRRRKMHWVAGMLTVMGAIALWLVPARASVSGEAGVEVPSEIGSNLFRQTIGRFFLGVSHREWPWYYLENLPIDLMPWTLFVPYVVLFAWHHRRDGQAERFLLAWIVPALIFFSLSLGKRALYLLPLYPAFAIVISRGMLDLYGMNRETWIRRMTYVWLGFAALTAVAPYAVLFTEYADTFNASFALFTASSVIAVGAWLCARSRGVAMPLVIAVAVHAFALELATAAAVLPAIDSHKSAAQFCEPMRDLNESGTHYDLYSLGFSREEYVFYSERFHTPLVYGLLDIAMPEAASHIEEIELQVKLRKALSDTMDDVHIAQYDPISAEDRATLRAHIDEVLADRDLPPGVPAAFRRALNAEVAPLFGDPSRPKLVMVQEEDYKWLLPLLDGLESYSVVKRRPVGSREMLLLANDAGLARLHTLE